MSQPNPFLPQTIAEQNRNGCGDKANISFQTHAALQFYESLGIPLNLERVGSDAWPSFAHALMSRPDFGNCHPDCKPAQTVIELYHQWFVRGYPPRNPQWVSVRDDLPVWIRQHPSADFSNSARMAHHAINTALPSGTPSSDLERFLLCVAQKQVPAITAINANRHLPIFQRQRDLLQSLAQYLVKSPSIDL